jgi:hypothetical protein
MSRTVFTLALAGVIGLAAGCAQQAPPSLDDAFGEFRSAYRAAETTEEKVALTEDFLTKYPESEYSAGLAGTVIYYKGEELGDKQGAYQVVEQQLAKIEDPEIRFDVQTTLYSLATELGKPADLAQVAADLEAHRALNFSENLDIMELAVENELWTVAEAHATKGLELASADAFRAEHPDEELTDEELAKKADNRRVLSLAHQAWALSNLDRADEAEAAFESAAELSTVNYLGVPETSLYTFWGQSALKAGDADRALELLAADAVLGDNDDALESFRAAFAAKHESEEGFDEFLWSERQRLAKAVDDFTLADYNETEQQFASLAEGKVTLLTFWFPT